MKIKVAINGFGRIGRQFLAIAEKHPELNVVAINDLADARTLAHLYKYDSVYGVNPDKIEAGDDFLQINKKKIQFFQESAPQNLPWKKLGVNLVIEATGVFRSYDKAEAHLKAGAKKVLISAPPKDDTPMYVIGCNEKKYNSKKENIVSMASCTTNALAPVAKILNQNFKILKGHMTTAHSYTSSQKLLDLPHKDLRRARAAALSIIPTTTGATKAVGKVLPELDGKLNGMAIRVPTPTVSLIDFTFFAGKDVTAEGINKALSQAAKGELKNVISVSDEPLVSIDYKQSSFSGVVDSLLTDVVDRNFVKVIIWYDNEWGYSTRLVEFAKLIGK